MGRDVGRSLLVAVIVVAGDTLFVLLTLSGRSLSLSLSQSFWSEDLMERYVFSDKMSFYLLGQEEHIIVFT